MGWANGNRGTEADRLRADEEALQQLKASGRDLSQPVPTVHTMRFDGASDAAAAREQLEGAGYRVEARETGDGSVVLDAHKTLLLDEGSITQERHAIQDVMNAYGATHESTALAADGNGGAAEFLNPSWERGEDIRGEGVPEDQLWPEGLSSSSSGDTGTDTYTVREGVAVDPEVFESRRSAADDSSTDVDASRISSREDLRGARLAEPGELPHEVDVTGQAPDGSTIDRGLSGPTGDAISGSTSTLSGDIQSRAEALGGDALAGSRLDPLGLMDTADATADAAPEGVDPFRMDPTSLYSADDAGTPKGPVDQLVEDAKKAWKSLTNWDDTGTPDAGTSPKDQHTRTPSPKKEVPGWSPGEPYYENPDAVDSTPPTEAEVADAVAWADSRGGTTQPYQDPNEFTSSGTPQMAVPRDDLVTMPADDGGTGGTTENFLGSNPVVNPSDPAGAEGYATGAGGYGGGGGGHVTPTPDSETTGSASYAMTGAGADTSATSDSSSAPSPVGGGGQIYSAASSGTDGGTQPGSPASTAETAPASPGSMPEPPLADSDASVANAATAPPGDAPAAGPGSVPEVDTAIAPPAVEDEDITGGVRVRPQRPPEEPETETAADDEGGGGRARDRDRDREPDREGDGGGELEAPADAAAGEQQSEPDLPPEPELPSEPDLPPAAESAAGEPELGDEPPDGGDDG